MKRWIKESIELTRLWSTVVSLWVRLQFNRWAESEQNPMHDDRPKLIVRISELEWQLRDLGFDYLI